MSTARIDIGQTKRGGCRSVALATDMTVVDRNTSDLKIRPTRKASSPRRRAGLTPRAAGEVDAENQYLDGHGG